MNILQIAGCVIAGASIGQAAMALFVGDKVVRLRGVIAAKDLMMLRHNTDVADTNRRLAEAQSSLDRQTTKCCELRQAVREKDQAIDKLRRRMAELEPLAERGRKANEQQMRASRAGLAALARKRAQNVTPIRKRAKKRA